MHRMFEKTKMTGIALLLATCLSLVPQALSADPTIPKQFTKFQASVEINQPGSAYTVGIKEYYDGSNNRSSMTITQQGNNNIVIHNHKNGEILDIQESTRNNFPVYTCTVKKITQDVEISSYINPSWLLREATESKETYVPNAKPIRGIPVYQWKADIAVKQGPITVNYFYSKPSWNNSHSLKNIPVQVKISGTFNIVYDYFDFLNDVPDESVFQTPEGAYCPGRKSTKTLPTIRDQVNYRVEYNDAEEEIIFSMDVWVDSRNHFVRIDYGYRQDSDDDKLMTEVHDFNSDVNYKIQRGTGTCTQLELSQKDQLDIDIESHKSSSGITSVTMKHPYEMFNFNHNFQYAGQRAFNGMLCDIFIAQVLNYQVSGVPFNVTMEYYFMADGWTEISNTEADIEMNVPLLLQIKSLDMTFIQIYRFFDFEQGSMYLSAFDVTECFSDDDKIDFQVDFTRPSDFNMAEKDELLEACHLEMAKATAITPLRIQRAKLHFDDNYIHFIATLVGLPQAYTQFVLDGNCQQLSKNKKLIRNIHWRRQCAQLCQDESSFTCNSFGFCRSQRLCSLSPSRTSDGQKVPGATCCQHFIRRSDVKLESKPTAKAWMDLKDSVYQGKEIVRWGSNELAAVAVRKDVLNGAQRELATQNWQKQFSRLRNHIIAGHDDLILTGIAADDCAAACNAQRDFYCFSFDFCYSNGECRLSRKSSNMHHYYLKHSTTCDVYNRNFEAWFNKYPGYTLVPQLEVVYQDVRTPSQCASLCFHYGEFLCRSFDFCEVLKTCVIGRKHIFDIPKIHHKVQPMCSHYSVNFLGDFKKTSNNMLKLEDDEVIADISEEECAKRCVENKNFVCMSFDYCTDSKLCLYRSKHFKSMKADSELQPTPFCSHYIRQHAGMGPKPPAKQVTSYSSGSMGALGFFMLIIGIGGTLLGVFLLKRQNMLRKDSLANMVKDDAIY